LAGWLVARRPGLLPGSLRAALLHLGISLGLVQFSPRLVAPLVGAGRLPTLVAFLSVLWALVYAWLAVAAVLRSVHNAIAE